MWALADSAVGLGAVVTDAWQQRGIGRWLASARGLGVGRRLLTELESHATDLGARSIRLETNDALVEAISLYRSAGYLEIPRFSEEAYAHHWFEKQLRAT